MKITDILPSRSTSLITEIFSSKLWQEIRCFLSSFTNRWVSVIWVCVAAIPPVLFVAEIVSIQQKIRVPVESQRVDSLKDTLESRLKENPSLTTVVGSHRLNSSPVAQRAIKVIAQRGNDERTQFQYENIATYRYDTIIVFTGLWLVVLYAIRTLGAKQFDYLTPDEEERIATTNKPREAHDINAFLSGAVDNISVLKDEVHFARRRALDIHQRSSIMLLAGIVMAFVGVGAFYASIPTVGPDTKLEGYLMQSLRPTAMLVFVEALAWFLLRQYRALSEEYRRFHRLAQRRADFLTAFMTVAQTNAPDSAVFVLTALLQEPPTLVLKKGESTEALVESMAASSNPIFDLANAVLQRVPLADGVVREGR